VRASVDNPRVGDLLIWERGRPALSELLDLLAVLCGRVAGLVDVLAVGCIVGDEAGAVTALDRSTERRYASALPMGALLHQQATVPRMWRRSHLRLHDQAVSHETIRQWCGKFGQTYANALRRRRPRPGNKWHLDEVFIKINGQRRYLWRAVDQYGAVLDILVTSRRNAQAATRFFRKLLKGLRYAPRVLITDKLASYGVARRRLMPGVEHRRSKYLNNRAENSHQPTRQRERAAREASISPARRVVVDLGTASAGDDGSTVGNAADCASVPGRVCWIFHAVPASSRPLRGGYGQPAPATVTRSAVSTVTKIV
jgi:transposase-like protein